VIAEVIPDFYDVNGKPVSRPKKRYHFLARPMGSFLTQPLKVVCKDIDEIRAFLSTCRYVSDHEQFGVRDHWAPPEKFEQTRRGDCDDFALWTWRQLLDLGYSARFVVGRAGRYGEGHAWVTFSVAEKTFIVEPLLARLARTFPRLDVLTYRPGVSVEAFGTRVKYYEHTGRTSEPRLREVMPLVPEWLLFRLHLVLLTLLAFTQSEYTRYARK
jgi:transglutaminase-like cysteine proteinase BTLCP